MAHRAAAGRQEIQEPAATASLSGDGRFVAFSSYARLIAADVDSLADIYVLD